jgi:hypothetical protein
MGKPIGLPQAPRGKQLAPNAAIPIIPAALRKLLREINVIKWLLYLSRRLFVVGSAAAAISNAARSHRISNAIGSTLPHLRQRSLSRCHDPNREYRLASNSQAAFRNVGDLQRHGTLSHGNDAVGQHGQRFTYSGESV